MSKFAIDAETIEDVILKASVRTDISVVRSDPLHLLLDLDTIAAIKQFEKVLPIAKSHFGASEKERWESKSGHLHVKLALEFPLTLTERLALQAMLGSDGVKEILSFRRAKLGQAEPIVLFRPRK